MTENSVTLAWSPEDPVAGLVTYSIWLRHVLHSPKGSGSTVWYTQIGGATTNLGDPSSWVTIATNPPTSSAFTFTDPTASQFPMRFYRVVSP